jgi:hypothetical protein
MSYELFSDELWGVSAALPLQGDGARITPTVFTDPAAAKELQADVKAGVWSPKPVRRRFLMARRGLRISWEATPTETEGGIARGGDGCAVAPAVWQEGGGVPVRVTAHQPEPGTSPTPFNPYAGRLTNKPKRRWLRRRR